MTQPLQQTPNQASSADLLDASERILAGDLDILDWFRHLPDVVTVEIDDTMATVICRGLGANVTAFKTSEGLVVCDTGSLDSAPLVFDAIARWAPGMPVHTIIFTHGHFDHVNGARLYLEDAKAKGAPAPRVIAHENVNRRFARYSDTAAHNQRINQRQYSRKRFPWPTEYCKPDLLVRDALTLEVGGMHFELHHARGETDDHLWIWQDRLQAVVAGDFVIWASPNAGNPQKVQRYAGEWGQALQSMLEKHPRTVVGGHGPVLWGRETVRTYLADTARWLLSLHDQTLALMNAGERLDKILHEVKPPVDLQLRPFLQPNYDDPEFVVRNIVRLYGGWWDGNPANLKPAPEQELARELVALCGGAHKMAARAEQLLSEGKLRLAGHLAEYCALASNEPAAHGTRARVNAARALHETSQMAKGIFRDAAAESERLAGAEEVGNERR